MYMPVDIRVRTSEKYKQLYNDLKNFVFRDMHEIFFTCAAIGYAAATRTPLGRAVDNRFWSGTITPHEFAMYYSIVAETKEMDYQSLLDTKSVVEVAEEYANAGMEILLEEVLGEYVIERESGPALDQSSCDELPKIILAYIYDKSLNETD